MSRKPSNLKMTCCDKVASRVEEKLHEEIVDVGALDDAKVSELGPEPPKTKTNLFLPPFLRAAATLKNAWIEGYF